jgi:hypothetical protein
VCRQMANLAYQGRAVRFHGLARPINMVLTLPTFCYLRLIVRCTGSLLVRLK